MLRNEFDHGMELRRSDIVAYLPMIKLLAILSFIAVKRDIIREKIEV